MHPSYIYTCLLINNLKNIREFILEYKNMFLTLKVIISKRGSDGVFDDFSTQTPPRNSDPV